MQRIIFPHTSYCGGQIATLAGPLRAPPRVEAVFVFGFYGADKACHDCNSNFKANSELKTVRRQIAGLHQRTAAMQKDAYP
jgi:hypothetical protein